MFDSVKAGDTLILSNGMHRRIIEVDRVTPTMVIAEGIKYSKQTAREAGCHSTWGYGTISPATDEIIAEIRDDERRRSLATAITTFCTRNHLLTLTTDHLEQIHKVLHG